MAASKLLMLLSSPFPLRPLRLSILRFRRVSSSASSPLRLSSSFPIRSRFHSQANAVESSNYSSPVPTARTPWASTFLDHIAAVGYSDSTVEDSDAEFAVEGVTEEFKGTVRACLAFARDRPDLIRLVSKKNIEALVENGSAFLFKNGGDSERRLRQFLSSSDGSNESLVLESEKAQTVDAMRYVLSFEYSSHGTQDDAVKGGELVEVSVRNFLEELINVSGNVRASKLMDTVPSQAPQSHDPFSRPPGQNIEMKRGDWICPKCTFMNFARNMRCLECDEARPKKQLTGAEWECPQCEFFNYGRNVSCLRCDCKRPGEVPSSTGYSTSSTVDQILSGSRINKSELEQKLAANDEKAERWFSKISQLDGSSDIGSAAADEDFPEIMPLRKGVNRFVVSNRKTPLERRLANSQSGISSGIGSDNNSESISKSLDKILGRASSSTAGEGNTGATTKFSSSDYSQSIAKNDPNYVPFVPLPPDMFSKSRNSSNEFQKKDPLPTEADDSMRREKEGELSYASDNVTGSDNAVPDDDFPEMMPMRKGENRFVVSKKKDRSLTSPQYKRRQAMEQANISDFVPFVPFPPDYFAKKDKQPEGSPVQNKDEKVAENVTQATNWGSTSNTTYNNNYDIQSYGNNTNWGTGATQMNNSSNIPNWGSTSNTSPRPESNTYTNNWGSTSTSSRPESNTYNNNYNMQPYGNNTNEAKSNWSGGASPANSTTNGPQRTENPQNTRESYNRGFPGKSLEGSAVKETDPLDMSEEAKAERWFRRVAQIKDISELSQIPDEDFPSIMPMRKGVNRFVVSKRKTPLERRLTSPQYRRNLPIVSSDPEKNNS